MALALALYAAAFFSGCAALVFELLWFRQAGLAIGRSVWTLSIVTAAFMAGLALGNLLAVRLKKTSLPPHKLFSLLQLVAAVSGAALVFLFPRLTELSVTFLRPFVSQPALLNTVRCVIVFLLMLLPAAAMGASFPALIGAWARQGSGYAPVLGAAYGWNTAGAAAGVLGCELFLIREHGIAGSGILAAGLSLLAAVFVYAGLRNAATAASPASGPEPGKRDDADPALPSRARLGWAAFITGFCMLSLETVWFRFLNIFFIQLSLSFAIMLAVVLGGIACGGIAASVVLRRFPRAARHAVPLAWLNGALIFAGYLLLPLLLSRPEMARSDSIPGLVASAAFLMLAPAVLSGALFVFIGGMYRRRTRDDVNASAGFVFLNTLGGAAGALCAGLALIPWCGIELSFALVIVLYGAAAACAGRGFSAAGSRRARFFYCAAAGLWLGAIAAFPFGLLRDYYSLKPVEPFLREGMRRVVLKEGVHETAQYLRADFLGRPHYFQLVTNSHPMASTSFLGRRYMEFLAFWPLAVHRSPKKVLVISYGTGRTAGVFAAVKGIEQIDAVDVSPDMFALSAVANPDNDPLKDPRVRKHVEDGRFFLAASRESYDIITGEPPPPKTQGVVNLYTAEYFRLMYARLAQGGIAAYWLPVSQLNAGEAKAITRSFCDSFDYCAVWAALPFEWMLVGTRGEAGSIPMARFSWLWKNPELGAELRRLGFETSGLFGTFFVADGSRLNDWYASSLPLTDNYPQRLSSVLPDAEYLDPAYYELLEPRPAAKNFRESPFIRSVWPFMETAQGVVNFKFRDEAYKILGGYEGISRMDRVRRCLEEKALRPYLSLALGSDPDAQAIIAETLAAGDIARIQDAREHLAAWVVERGDFQRAADYYAWLAANDPVPDDLWDALRIYFLFIAGDVEKARAAGAEYIARFPRDKEARGRRVADLWRWMDKHPLKKSEEEERKKQGLLDELTRQLERIQTDGPGQ